MDNWPADGPGRSATEQTITGRIVSQLHGQSLACGAELGQGGFGGLRLLRSAGVRLWWLVLLPFSGTTDRSARFLSAAHDVLP